MFKKIVGQNKFLWIPPYLKSGDSRIPGFGILFKNSNSGFPVAILQSYIVEIHLGWALQVQYTVLHQKTVYHDLFPVICKVFNYLLSTFDEQKNFWTIKLLSLFKWL